MNDTAFNIEARTCTLLTDLQDDNTKIKHALLTQNVKYEVPIYQRPYSWTEPQIRKLISDIFLSYWGTENTVIEEPMFIGTMQLSAKEKHNCQQIIDGQQRITTLILLIRVMQLEFPNDNTITTFPLDFLTTKVNNGKQQEYLSAMLKSGLSESEEKDELNTYIKNIHLVRDVFKEQLQDDEDGQCDFDAGSFFNYITTKLYFVIIETKASLSKTLQIFDAINTTGLDLNGGDLFKVRFFDYLTQKCSYDQEVFEEISELYQKIDEHNALLKRQVSDINEILRIYQYILIAKYNLSNTLYTLAASTFFERLFDLLLNINTQWDNYIGAKEVKLSLEDLQSIVEVRYEWENSKYPDAETACAMHFIWESRYGRHWIMVFVYLFSFNDVKDKWDNLWLFTKQLSKVYIIYSIRFQKAINYIHTFTYNVMQNLVNNTPAEVINHINSQIGTLAGHWQHSNLTDILNGDITYNFKMKNIICRLSAMLEEKYDETSFEKINELRDRIFSDLDIEHIQSYHHKEVSLNEAIWAEWGTDINSLGNLMVLEQKINRSIGNIDYGLKMIKYKDSLHPIVQKQMDTYAEWNLTYCRERKQYEVNKITSYLFPVLVVEEREKTEINQLAE